MACLRIDSQLPKMPRASALPILILSEPRAVPIETCTFIEPRKVAFTSVSVSTTPPLKRFNFRTRDKGKVTWHKSAQSGFRSKCHTTKVNKNHAVSSSTDHGMASEQNPEQRGASNFMIRRLDRTLSETERMEFPDPKPS
jgi:hypothetical protein